MAIRNIKEIIDNRGYVVNQRDRSIFEKEDLQTFFGLSNNDAIEFILYDINDNQLPQNIYGNVRYISLTTENINDYLMIAEGTKLSKNNLPEYFIDVERLIREAGYNNGVFKVQITLINKRVGSNDDTDKLWIQQISPSRTEIRLLPLERSNNIEDLQKRFNILYRDGGFRDDVAPYVTQFLEQVSAVEARERMEEIFGTDWIQRLATEFKIQDISSFLTKVYNKFIEASHYEFSNRISDITDTKYGQTKDEEVGLELSKQDVVDTCMEIMQQCININLPERDKTKDAVLDIHRNASINEMKIIHQRTEAGDTFFDTKATVERVTVKNPPEAVGKTITFDAPPETTTDDEDEIPTIPIGTGNGEGISPERPGDPRLEVN